MTILQPFWIKQAVSVTVLHKKFTEVTHFQYQTTDFILLSLHLQIFWVSLNIWKVFDIENIFIKLWNEILKYYTFNI